MWRKGLSQIYGKGTNFVKVIGSYGDKNSSGKSWKLLIEDKLGTQECTCCAERDREYALFGGLSIMMTCINGEILS